MQLQICEAYPASSPDYHVIEMIGEVFQRAAKFLPDCVEAFSLVEMTADFHYATGLARQHCVSRGVEVWVIDRNDGDFVALRVTPEEYSRGRAAEESVVALL